MQPLNFFVVQGTDGNLAKASRWKQAGWLRRVYLQVHGNLPDLIAANRANWQAWTSTLGREAVYAWFIGSADSGEDANLITDLRGELNPFGWVPNDENPTKWTDRTAALDAMLPDPVIVSLTGYPSISPYAVKQYVQAGARIEYQSYLGNIENVDPSVYVSEAYMVPRVHPREPGAPMVWWYRVFFDSQLGSPKRWAWAQVTGFADGVAKLREGRNTWGVKAAQGEYGLYVTERAVFNLRTKRNVGFLYGLVPYPLIRVALSVERDETPEQIRDMAVKARAEGAAVRGVTLYTLDNTTHEHVELVAEAL